MTVYICLNCAKEYDRGIPGLPYVSYDPIKKGYNYLNSKPTQCTWACSNCYGDVVLKADVAQRRSEEAARRAAAEAKLQHERDAEAQQLQKMKEKMRRLEQEVESLRVREVAATAATQQAEEAHKLWTPR